MRVHYIRDSDPVIQIATPPSQIIAGEIEQAEWDRADYLVLDGWLSNLTAKRNLGRVKEWLLSRPWFKAAKSRLVLFDYSDPYQKYGPGWAKVLFRASYNKNIADPNTFSIPFVFSGTQTLEGCVRPCRFLSPVTFVGFGWPKLRVQLAAQVRTAIPEAHIAVRDRYFYQYGLQDRLRYQQELEAGFERSPFVLCPRGAGLGSQRLFECLAWGRIPVVVSDGYEFPFSWAVPWESFALRVGELDVKRGVAGITVREAISAVGEAQVRERMAAATAAWQLQLSPPHWGRHIRDALASCLQT